MTRAILVLISVLIAAACTRGDPAPIVYGGTWNPVSTKAPGQPQRQVRYTASRWVPLPDVKPAAFRTSLSAYTVPKPAAKSVAREGTHIVVAGDTVYSISRRYGADLQTLIRDNKLRYPFRLRIGRVLWVPNSAKPQARTFQIAKAAASRPAAKAATPKRIDQPSAARKPAAASARPTKRSASGPQFDWPTRGRIISRYGVKRGGLHNDGINIAVAKGAPVRASADGEVVYAGNELRGFGNLVLIRHPGGWTTAYAHNDALLVKRGDKVRRGHLLARAGSSGSVKRTQLHFEIRKGTEAVDPMRFLASGRKVAAKSG